MPQPDATPISSRRASGNTRWLWWLALAVLVLVSAARLRLLTFPLERDEGEYAYAGQLILQGIPPYELADNMKFPGTYLAYAAIMALFGETPAAIHFGILLLTTATALMLFWLGRKLADDIMGLVAGSSYLLLAAGTSMLGQAGHATHFCAFFITAGMCLMWRFRQKEGWLMLAASGALFGTAVLMKQQAVVVAAWAGLSFAFSKLVVKGEAWNRRLAMVAVFGFAMLAPLGLTCLWLWHAGVFAAFKFWTFDYARQYASIVTPEGAWKSFLQNFSWVITCGALLWVLAAVGLILAWFDRRLDATRGWYLGFCASSALAVCPDFYFRPHYFLIAVPALALLAGTAVSAACQWPAGRRYAPAFFALIVATTVATCANKWYFMPKFTLARELYGFDPLPEAGKVAAFIQENSRPSDTMAVIGSEPELYFLAHRHSVTGYIYIYALSEDQPYAGQMRQQMILDIESRYPKFIVLADTERWFAKSHNSVPSLFEWWENYQTNYTRVAVADIIDPTHTTYAFGTNEVARHGVIHRCALEIYERK